MAMATSAAAYYWAALWTSSAVTRSDLAARIRLDTVDLPYSASRSGGCEPWCDTWDALNWADDPQAADPDAAFAGAVAAGGDGPAAAAATVPTTFAEIDAPGGLRLIYSDPAASLDPGSCGDACKCQSGTGCGWNREHSWPQSWGASQRRGVWELGRSMSPEGSDGPSAKGETPILISAVARRPMQTDLMAMFPADVGVNSARNNRPFYDVSARFDAAEVLCGAAAATDAGPTVCEPVSEVVGSWVWQPAERERGDLARAAFYMSLRYDGTTGGTGIDPLDLIIGEPESLDDPTLRPENSTDANCADLSSSCTHQDLRVLVAWHCSDPVDAYERARHARAAAIQHNRNPFVDRPEWVATVFGQQYACPNDNVDACIDHPCGANAVCEDLPAPASNDVTGRTCVCADGYVGDAETGCTDLGQMTAAADAYCQLFCSGEVSPCDPGFDANCPGYCGTEAPPPPPTCTKVCANGGTCVVGSDGTETCACTPDYTGQTCTDAVCTKVCANGGTCLEGDPGPDTCSCAPGFTGDTCEIDIDDCAQNPCNGGTCTDGINSYTCTCATGWSGATCSVDVDECATGNTCYLGDPTTVDDNATCTNTPGSYTCTCGMGYEGDGREGGTGCTNANACDVAPCGDNADCVDQPPPALKQADGRTCTCRAGFSGAPYDLTPGGGCTDIDECADSAVINECVEGTICINTPGSFTCGDVACPTPNGDGSSPYCSDHGECVDVTSGVNTCTCATGWTGTFCETDVDECTDGTDDCDPNNATCTNTAGSFTCACNQGYEGNGVTCTEVNRCSPNPCQNGGTCTNGINSYTCSCVPGSGWTGDTCETCGDDCSLYDNDMKLCSSVCDATSSSTYCTFRKAGGGKNRLEWCEKTDPNDPAWL